MKRVKTVCRACKLAHKKGAYIDAKGVFRHHTWGVREGILWEQKGRVICPFQGEPDFNALQKGRFVWEPPPDDCPYLAEMAVSQ